jgi:hypothetical protein
MPAGQDLRPAIRETLAEAMAIFLKLAAPIGVAADATAADFQRVFEGEGRNAPDTPLGRIFPKARRLVLYAATIGPAVEQRISALFAEHKYDLGYLLDAVASEAADRAGGQVERHYRSTKYEVRSTNVRTSDFALRTSLGRRYGPGYCGWHVSGQRRLFEVLKPEEIGITLNGSYLMQPLKSVSGAIVIGRPEIHEFAPEFGFCSECRARECRVQRRGSIDD